MRERAEAFALPFAIVNGDAQKVRQTLLAPASLLAAQRLLARLLANSRLSGVELLIGAAGNSPESLGTYGRHVLHVVDRSWITGKPEAIHAIAKRLNADVSSRILSE